MFNKERKATKLIDKASNLLDQAKDILEEKDIVLGLKGSKVSSVKKVREGKYILDFSNGDEMHFYLIDD